MLRVILFLMFSINSFASVDLKIQTLDKKSWSIFCAGVEIMQGVYATAAHCVNEFKPNELKIKNSFLKSLLTHKHYKKGYKFDQLDFAIVLGAPMGKISQTANVKLGDIIDFKGQKFKIVEVSDYEFKANALGKSACLSDSGHPAYKGEDLVGILSRGDIGCKKFAIFTKIRPIMDWHLNKSKVIQMAKRSKITNLKYFIQNIRRDND